MTESASNTIILRKEAKELGLKRYFTGKPCPRGHVAERNTKSSVCLNCGRLSSERYSRKSESEKGKGKESLRGERWKAIQDGEARYRTGKPCHRGHVSDRYTGSGVCVVCHDINKAKFYDANPHKAKEYWTRSREKNRDRANEQARQRRASNAEEFRKKDAAYRKKNLAKIRAQERRLYYRNREKILEYRKRWAQENPEKIKAIRKRCYARRRARASVRVSETFSNSISRGLRSGGKSGGSAWGILPYSLEELIDHLKDGFEPGMSLENYGDWHIDHIIPLSAFNFETVDCHDFRRAWALENLQPMWARENQSKSDRLERPFQPSLI